MSATRIALVSVGVSSLILAGLYSWLPGIDEEQPPAEVVVGPALRRQRTSRTGSTQLGSNQLVTPRPAATGFPLQTTPRTAENHGSAELRQDQVASTLEEALATARHDTKPQQRIEALQFLGEYARQEHLDALQQIQLQDPAPEVRRAAETAVHNLLARFTGQPWPGITSEENPFDYMKRVPSPGVP